MCQPGRGRTSFVDARDVAAVSVRVLAENGHRNTARAFAGVEALSYVEVTDCFSEVLGRLIRYANPSVLNFIRHMRGEGHPWPFVVVMTGIYLAARFGLAGTVTGDLERMLGRHRPRCARSYATTGRVGNGRTEEDWRHGSVKDSEKKRIFRLLRRGGVFQGLPEDRARQPSALRRVPVVRFVNVRPVAAGTCGRC